MRKTQLSMLVGTAALMLAVAGSAVASVPTPTKIATTASGNTPRVFVDDKGTVSMVWTAQAGGYFTVRYARKPAGATRFTEVALPYVFDDSAPFIYQPSPGALRIIVENGTNSGVDALNSTNDGASWTTMDTTALNAGQFQTYDTYPDASELVDAPGGPIERAGDSGNVVVQLNGNLTGETLLATAQTLSPESIARTTAGETFILGESSTAGLPFQVGAVTGQLSFPVCASTRSSNPDLVAGRSVAVVAEVSCGHLRTRTITAGGVVGPLVTIGSSPGDPGADTLGTSDGVDMVADRSGNFTASYLVLGGDLSVAHSSDGSHWTTTPGFVPVPSSLDGSNVAISTGAATWLGSVTATSNTTYAVLAIALSSTYRTPSAPSARGIADPRRGSLGSLAVTVPGKLALKSFRKTGKVTLRLVDAIPDRISGSITVSRTSGNTTEDVCSGGANDKLAVGRVRTVTYTCGSSAIVIGGTLAAGVSADKGDLVTFTFGGRNGTLTLTSRVG
jgi:hypothetical protein